ncbi:hypothetical protein A1O1_02938 [Capronia coronata CBS 617.96]|uniref:Nucleolar pre-ribosomal-associated protein 1 C-terminal domain-containing protein n=1 Tax=Capronia coronata CBS 617.96 TaxID=1182541 RepID=W9YNN8_9EURO|nr:uncharacterized protein A1O1_02938 [Capronia coronata CBS 617.96]EXJ94542.1 hypothetical protein A1O1_02938 [Capronia coronata CBS 617.96]
MAVDEERSRKRRKVDGSTSATSISFKSADQIHRLLQSSQGSSPQVVAAIERFKHFLYQISEDQNIASQTGQLKVLKEYCDLQSSASHEEVDFPDLLSIWYSASQSNDEAVLSAVPSVLTQFFRTISSQLEFREFGLSLCHSLLKRDQLRIFDKGLSLPRSKQQIITPCLQLLTEIISFDGGALASNVFGRRDYLYRRLDGLLSQLPSESTDTPTPTPTSGVHKAALEFLLASLKYLDSESKTELITHGRTLYSAVRSLPSGSADVITKALDTLERSVLADESLAKQIKRRCFNSGFLAALAKLYDYPVESSSAGDGGDHSTSVREALQRLLLQVCTTTKGVLVPQTGWYPPGTNPESLQKDDSMIDLGLDSPFYFDDFTEKVPVKNGTLAIFIQTLKPESDVLQANLIISIFAAAPELVADYTSKKQKLVVPPGDDPLWRGQFAFLFSVVKQPVPPNCGWPGKTPSTPPPLSIVIESILPKPLDRSTLTKCLQTKDDIIMISATRVLTVALEKLDSALKIFDTAPSDTTLWAQAATRLMNLFIERIPPLQDLVTALQSLDKDNEQVRTTVLECMATYHKILPSTTVASKFDIGPTLSKTLQSLESDSLEQERRDVLQEQMTHLVQIADASLATKWFHRTSSEPTSLVVQLLQYCAQWPDTAVTKQSLPVVQAVLCGKGILSSTMAAFQALLFSLTPSKKWQPEIEMYQFLDNCITRTMQRPVKYLDRLEQMQQLLSDTTDLSLIACCIAEQWSFVLKKEDKSARKNIVGWVARLFSALEAAGQNWRVLNHLREEMERQAEGMEKAKAAFVKAFEKQQKKTVTLPPLVPTDSGETPEAAELGLNDKTLSADHAATNTQYQETESDMDMDKTFAAPAPIPTSLSGLDRWTKPDFESEIKSGRLASLLRCLISPDTEIRLQVFHTLQTVMHAVEQSTFPEKTQLYLLLGEVYETLRLHSISLSVSHSQTHTHTDPSTTLSSASSSLQPARPPPSIIAELAIQTLPVLADPSSPFYRKTNKFLLRAPSWPTSSILPYWLSLTFLTEPDSDDTDVGGQNAQALEIDRLLDLLANSLRTDSDMDLFRRAHVFARLFAYFLAPVCSKQARKKILRVVHIATTIPGASDTLITRAGVREWLAIARNLRDHSGHGAALFGKVDAEISLLVDVLAKEVERSCDAEAIARWESQRSVFKAGDATGMAGGEKKDG